MLKKIFIAFLIIFVICIAGIGGIILYAEWKLDKYYEEMIQQGNKECSENTERVSNQLVTIKIGDKKVIKKYGDIVYVESTIEFPDRKSAYDEDYTIETLTSVRLSALYDIVESLYEEPIDAAIMHSYDYGWELKDEYDDYYFDIDEVCRYLDNELYNGNTNIELDSFLKRALVTVDDLISDYEKVSWLNAFKIQYSGVTYLTGEDLVNCVDGYDLNINEIDLSGIKSCLTSVFDTHGKTVDFHTTSGDTVTVKYGTLGRSVNWDKEKADILSAIENHESLFKSEPYLYGYDDMSSEYIEISLTDQHVWHYKDNSLCCESDCVTGLKNKMDTPKGVYYISECIPGKYLIGDNNSYKVWVDRWMRLTNSGIGLHDASSRSKFGGDIYTYNGSHGCINLPPKYAYSLFDEMRNGVAVIIY